MHAYCTRVLHFSEDAAFKRIRAARIARRYPQIFEAIAQGLVHLTAVVLLAPHFTDDNVDDLLTKATHRSKTEVEILVAALAPRPDLPTRIDPVAPTSEPLPLPQLVPEPPPHAPPPPPRVTPLAPERFALRVTIGQATRDKLERATALLRHRNPSGDVAEVLDRALDALLGTLEKEMFGATSRPRAKGARQESADPRHVSNEVRRAVHARHGEQCTFVSADGVRCTERGFLELDHRTPVARGGQPTVAETRILCRAHNQYEAERIFGADFMREKRRKTRSARATKGALHGVDDPAPISAPVSVGRGSEGSALIGAELAAPIFDESAAPATSIARQRGDVGADGPTASSIGSMVAATAVTSGKASTFEDRIRAALGALYRSRSFRCSDGPLDGYADRLGAFRACA